MVSPAAPRRSDGIRLESISSGSVLLTVRIIAVRENFSGAMLTRPGLMGWVSMPITLVAAVGSAVASVSNRCKTQNTQLRQVSHSWKSSSPAAPDSSEAISSNSFALRAIPFEHWFGRRATARSSNRWAPRPLSAIWMTSIRCAMPARVGISCITRRPGSKWSAQKRSFSELRLQERSD